ncbi:MAG: MarR family transcriptional regulator [Candidatus Saccharibacteria bacterium]
MSYNEAMISKRLQEELSLLIIRSSMKGKYAIVQIAEDNHITPYASHDFVFTRTRTTRTMKSLAKFMSCDPSNVTGIIEQLVSEGFVDRKESLNDRRIKTVSLTNKGLALRDKFLEITTSTRLPNLDSLSDDEIEQLIAILEKANRN